MNSWRECPLGEVIELKRGYDLPKRLRTPGQFPVISSSGTSGSHSEAKVKGPGVVTGRYGTLGEVFYVEDDFWPLNTALYVRDFKGNDERFISYFLRTIDFYAFSDKAAVPGVNRNHVHKALVRVPDVGQQRRIAHILGTLDDKIELNRRMNQTLEAIARAIFKSWFVDFDPVHAKAEGREPVGMDPEIAALFPRSFADSACGKMPVGWTVSALSDLASYLKRGISPAYVKSGGICVLNQKCIRGRLVNFAAARRHDPDSRPVKGRTLEALDILVNSTGVGTLGRVAQLWDLPETVIADSHISVVRAGTCVDPWFLGTTLLSREDEIGTLGEGSTGQTELSRAVLGGLLCVVPPAAVQKAFGHFVAPLFLKIVANQRAASVVESLRTVLLPKLISGELETKDRTHIGLEATHDTAG